MYTVTIVRAARKDLARLPVTVASRVDAVIQALATDPRPAGCIKLAGSPYWRVRVGDYRILYEVDEDRRVITVVQAGHRQDV